MAFCSPPWFFRSACWSPTMPTRVICHGPATAVLAIPLGRWSGPSGDILPVSTTGSIDGNTDCSLKDTRSRTALSLSRLPIGTEPTQHRMIHFIARMLRELDIELVKTQAENLDAGVNKSLCQIHALFGGPPAANVAHQQSRLVRLALATAPNASFPELANRDRYSLDVRLHLRCIDLAEAPGELLLLRQRIRLRHVNLQIRHSELLSFCEAGAACSNQRVAAGLVEKERFQRVRDAEQTPVLTALPDHHQADRCLARLVNWNRDRRPIKEIEQGRIAEQFRADVTLVAFALFDRGCDD